MQSASQEGHRPLDGFSIAPQCQGGEPRLPWIWEKVERVRAGAEPGRGGRSWGWSFPPWTLEGSLTGGV